MESRTLCHNVEKCMELSYLNQIAVTSNGLRDMTSLVTAIFQFSMLKNVIFALTRTQNVEVV